jgi:multiple sugar transport system permease protein
VLAVIPSIAYGLPLSGLLRTVGLYGTFPALVLACAAAQLPLALWLLCSYAQRVPAELADAARLDGASWWATMGRVGLPLLRDGLVATGVLVFVLDWNLYLLPTLLAERSPHLLTVVMRDFFAFERELEWPTAAAALLVSLLPAALLVFAAQRALEGLVVAPEEAAR